MDGFTHPIFSSGAADGQSNAYLDNDLDDIFVDDFMGGGDDSSTMPGMAFDDFTTPLPPFSQPMQASTQPMDSIGAANGVFMGSSASSPANSPALPQARASGAALLQQSAYPSNAGVGGSAAAATLAGIAANPDTSKYVASAALAATHAARSLLESSVQGSGSANLQAASSPQAAASKATAASRARRPSARAASEKIKEVVAEERSAVKRPLEPDQLDSEDDDDDLEDDDDDGTGSNRGKRRRSMNQSERQARR